MALLFRIRELNRRGLRRERLVRDRTNPIDFYDDIELKKLFRFERTNIFRLTDTLSNYLSHQTHRGKSLSPIQQV